MATALLDYNYKLNYSLVIKTKCQVSFDKLINLVEIIVINILNHIGDGDGSGMYGVLASKFGSGASKIGKKVAQSEAGKSAGRAAIKGASDAAANDLSNRYFGEAETKPTTTVTAPMKTLTVETGGDNPSVVPSQKSVSSTVIDSNDQSVTRSTDHSNTNGTSSYQRASKLSRFKPNLNFKSSEKPAKVQPRMVVKKEKVYKYVLTKKPDWDSLPQALTLYNYRAEMKCDLEFRKGQVIQVMTRTDSQNDWWEGKLEGRVGIFPANYVKFI